ncbi:MAG: hypothetical protein ACI37Z_08320 [Candidatus Gastranaerophilaceae bacterium]
MNYFSYKIIENSQYATMVIMDKKLTLIDYDSMTIKCHICKKKEKFKLSKFQTEELYICSRNRSFVKDYEKHGKNLCLLCFKDFLIDCTDLDGYEIWQIK